MIYETLAVSETKRQAHSDRQPTSWRALLGHLQALPTRDVEAFLKRLLLHTAKFSAFFSNLDGMQ